MGKVKAEIFYGLKAITGVSSDLDEIAARYDQHVEPFSSIPAFFADAALWNANPVAVVLRDSKGLFGAALFHRRTIRGLPSGILTSGHKCGRGATISGLAERPMVAELAARAVLRKMVGHTVLIRLPAERDAPLPGSVRTALIRGRWQRRDASNRLSLDGGLDGLMGRFSYKMRRNLRYYRKRADEELGCVFFPHLSPEQTRQTLQELSRRSTFPIKISTTLNYAAELAKVDGSFACGLQDNTGRWISLITGYRDPDTSYITLQLNHADVEATSLMTVMRSHFLEHEVELGRSGVSFIGGSNPSWLRACLPEVCHELLAIRLGIQTTFMKTFGTWIQPAGLISEVYG